jgi:hypothetical protein
MNAARVVLAAAILLMGVWANLNSDVKDGWVDDGIAVHSDEPVSLVGLQEEEEWLIVRVQFPGKPFSQSRSLSALNRPCSVRMASRGIELLQSTIPPLPADLPEKQVHRYERLFRHPPTHL